jgi:hypothetical protein
MKKLSPLLNDVNKTAIIVDCLLKSSLYAYHAKHILSNDEHCFYILMKLVYLRK